MKVEVYFTPSELAGSELPERVVVIDVLRATSTIVEALSNGAKAVVPVGTADEAVRLAQNVGRDSVLLCGERKGLPIEGFDLGNSPLEFTPDRVEGASLAMTTTNGTRAFLALTERAGAAEGPLAIVAAAFLNLSAVSAWLSEGEGAVAILCAGREGRFALEDALAAGALVRALESDVGLDLNDAAVAARSLAESRGPLDEVLRETAAGRHLESIGHAEDLEFCARLDRADVVPRLRDRKITVE